MEEKKINDFLNSKAKPPYSLGLLEDYGKKIMLLNGQLLTRLDAKHMVFASDNGICEEGVVIQNTDITRRQAENMCNNGATINQLCNFYGVNLEIHDVGIKAESNVIHQISKKSLGTKNFLKEPAMTQKEFDNVYTYGYNRVKKDNHYHVFSFGEMGIGNTTTSATVLGALTYPSININDLVGYGAFKDETVLARKKEVVNQMMDKKIYSLDAYEIVRLVGGFDIVAIMGAMKACSELKKPFVLDGYITTAALYALYKKDNSIIDYVIPSHCSREPGMKNVLKLMGLEDTPLNMNMALGEGSGAVMMIGLLKMFFYTINNMNNLSDL